MNEANNNDTDAHCQRQGVRDFFADKKVFLTGGTGFLGKVLIEKMLRALAVDTIYILIREKKGKNIHSRIDELTDDIYFDELKKLDPKFKHKLVPINGDCSMAGLGVSISDVQSLVEHVDIVVHCAATVRFDERLDKSYAINVTGTRSLIRLCHQMRRLAAFVHVSTAYSNCHLPHIEEKFYDYQLTADQVAGLLDKMTPEEIDQRTPEIIQNWPNTYSFTKALAESLVREECAKLPVAVFRPAIILSTYSGATPGWIDNFYGPVGGTASTYAGFGRVICLKENDSCNIVPVDKVADGILAALWEVGTRPKSNHSQEIKIYNYVSSLTDNDITWEEYIHFGMLYVQNYPLANMKREVSVRVTRTRAAYTFFTILYHYLPALLLDACLLLSGGRPKIFQLYRKLNHHMSAVLFFVWHAWSFRSDNVDALYASLSDGDRRLLPMSMHDLNWKVFLKNYVLGVRKYLLKDDPSTIPAARERMRRLQWISWCVKYALLFIVAQYTWTTLLRVIY